MCFMEQAILPPARDTEKEKDINCLLTSIVANTSMDALMTPGLKGGAWVHLARSPELLSRALASVHESGRDVKLLINLPNHNGQSAYDVAWNNALLSEELRPHGGKALKPLPNDTGKTGKGRGKGVAECLGPKHPLNSEYWRQR